MLINLNGTDLAFGCRRVVSELEGFDLKSFRNGKSIHNHTHTYIETIQVSEVAYCTPINPVAPVLHATTQNR